PALPVDPVPRRLEAGVEQHRAKALDGVLARVLGVDPLAGREATAAARPRHRERLARFEMHLDPRLRLVEERDVAPLARREVAADQPVEVPERVAIERRRDAEAVVVRSLEDVSWLDGVDADQTPAGCGAGAP